MFLTPTDFRQALADTLKMDVADLGPYWDRLCQQAQQSAYYDVRGALLARGFTAAQADAWDRGAEFERDIGLYWCLVRGGSAVPAIAAEQLDRLDRRKELETVPVESAAAPQPPAADPGRVSFGVLSTTSPTLGDDKWTRDTVL